MGVEKWKSAFRAFRKSWKQSDEPNNPVLDIEEVRECERDLTRRAQAMDEDEIEKLATCLESDQASAELRCESYLLLLTSHRRYKNLSKARELGNRYHRGVLRQCYEDTKLRFLTLHIYSVLLKETETPAYIEESVRLARDSLELLPGYPGALHNLAGGLLRQASLIPITDSRRQEVLDEALALVGQALMCDPLYPKFHATRASVLAMLGRHDEAEQEIRQAIDAEDSRHKDYAIRLSDYLNIKSDIALARTTTDMKSKIAAASRDVLIESRRANIQILTIFTALISFLIGGLTLVSTFSFEEAARLIFLLAAAILLALTGFGTLYEGALNGRRLAVSLTVAVGLLVIAHILPITITITGR